MEYIPGSTLRSTMPVEGFGADKARVIAWLREYYLPMLDGVAAIHDAGIIHRDIKPENILLDGSVPKIADFGLARVLKQPGLTHTFHVLGTIFYMSKQQFEDGAAVDARADIYALGKVLYEAITGKITNASKVIFKEVGLRPGVNERYTDDFFINLHSIIQRTTSEEEEYRTSDVKKIAEEIRAIIAIFDSSSDHAPMRRWDKRLWFAFIGILSLLAILIVVVMFHFSKESIQRDKVTETSNTSIQPPGAQESQNSQWTQVEDGAKMVLMPAGIQTWLPLRGEPEEEANVSPFYAEPSLVSNRRFVTYLNAVKEQLTVSDNTVTMNGTLVFMLGEIREGYEPMIYESGSFRLSTPAAADEPVVRVSGEGAQAYARYYGRELPTTAQWLTIRQQGLMQTGSSQDIKEWGLDRFAAKERYYIFGESAEDSAVYCPLPRQKWEAFEHAGFRTVRPLA